LSVRDYFSFLYFVKREKGRVTDMEELFKIIDSETHKDEGVCD